MAQKQWYVSKVCYCEHAGREITLETEVLLPSELLPEQAPRILSHRCSDAVNCDAINRPTCAWRIANADYHPL